MDTMCCHEFPHCNCNGNHCGNTCPIAFASAAGRAVPLSMITTVPINVVSATIDTWGRRDSTSLIIFTSTISTPAGVPVTLYFQLTRTNWRGVTTKVGPVYTFATLAAAFESESFMFQFADPNLRPGSHTYSVEVSTSPNAGLTVDSKNPVSSYAVDNSFISILNFDRVVPN